MSRDVNQQKGSLVYLKSAPREAAMALSSPCFLLSFFPTHTTTPARGAAGEESFSGAWTHTHTTMSNGTGYTCLLGSVCLCVCSYLRPHVELRAGCECLQVWGGVATAAVHQRHLTVPVDYVRQGRLRPLPSLGPPPRGLQRRQRILRQSDKRL